MSAVLVRPAQARDQPRWRELYDQYTPHSGFLRYVILNPDA